MTRPTRLRQRFSSGTGFTVPELLMSVAIFSTLAAITAMGFTTAARSVKGTSGMQQAMAQLRMARDMAISQRRSVEVQFVDPGEIDTIRWEIPNGTTVVNQYFLEGNVRFHRFPAVPDTPDGFGIAGPVSFQGQTSRFLSDGRWVDASGAPVSGNIFLAIEGQPMTQRAVTIFGGTGRIRGYRWDGVQWLE